MGLKGPAFTKERLAMTRERAATLDRETDRMTERLREAQGLFAGLRLGVTATVPMPNGKTLGYGRVGSEWCLHIEDSQTPILNASRADRVVAASVLESMAYALFDAVERELASLNKAIETLDGILRAFKEAMT